MPLAIRGSGAMGRSHADGTAPRARTHAIVRVHRWLLRSLVHRGAPGATKTQGLRWRCTIVANPIGNHSSNCCLSVFGLRRCLGRNCLRHVLANFAGMFYCSIAARVHLEANCRQDPKGDRPRIRLAMPQSPPAARGRDGSWLPLLFGSDEADGPPLRFRRRHQFADGGDDAGDALTG